MDFQEEDAFDNLRQITDTDSTQKTQNQMIMDDEEIQSRLRRASGMDAPPVSSSNIDQELSVSQQSEQAEDFHQEVSADEEEYSEEENFEDEPEMERGRSWTLEM